MTATSPAHLAVPRNRASRLYLARWEYHLANPDVRARLANQAPDGTGWEDRPADRPTGRKAEARRALGGLSAPSKMPGWAFGLPAAGCRTGSKLRAIAGSVCTDCYAYGRGMYGMTTAPIDAQVRRLLAQPELADTWSEQWVAWARLAAVAIHGTPDRPARVPYFRWHDSGDVRGFAHALALVYVAELRPDMTFWVPSKEVADWRRVRAFLAVQGTPWPSNLTVRVSAAMVGRTAPKGGPTSTVGGTGQNCPAPTQGNACQDCRSCWDSGTENINYHLH